MPACHEWHRNVSTLGLPASIYVRTELADKIMTYETLADIGLSPGEKACKAVSCFWLPFSLLFRRFAPPFHSGHKHAHYMA